MTSRHRREYSISTFGSSKRISFPALFPNLEVSLEGFKILFISFSSEVQIAICDILKIENFNLPGYLLLVACCWLLVVFKYRGYWYLLC